ncbi:MAG: hypothetical protein ABII82_13405, partial [Verrucomicrobiota bacterium]
MQLRLLETNAAVTTRLGVAGLKAAVDSIGMYGGPVRGPLIDLNPVTGIGPSSNGYARNKRRPAHGTVL